MKCSEVIGHQCQLHLKSNTITANKISGRCTRIDEGKQSLTLRLSKVSGKT